MNSICLTRLKGDGQVQVEVPALVADKIPGRRRFLMNPIAPVGASEHCCCSYDTDLRFALRQLLKSPDSLFSQISCAAEDSESIDWCAPAYLASRLAHLCRSHPCGSIREQAAAAIT